MAESVLPRIAQPVVDSSHPRRAAEFYRRLLGLHYRDGDEPPPTGDPDPRGDDWLVLLGPDGGRALAFQQAEVVPTTWPGPGVPMQLHLDTIVSSREELGSAHELALSLGARVLVDRSDDEDEPLWVYADLDGHPFCVFVGAG